MDIVVVRPERCVGCRQCELACAATHSRSQTLFGAIHEERLPLPRIHIGAGAHGEPFPNRCRHCDPAPCQQACLPGAIQRDANTGTVTIDALRCIRCASCAMACPFGVIRFHDDPLQEAAKPIAYKCDNCLDRQARGDIPACVEVCKVGALVFKDLNEVLQEKTREVARQATLGLREAYSVEMGGMQLLREVRARMIDVSA